MDHALVVYDNDASQLLEEAGELAAGVDAEVTVLRFMTEDEFDETLETIDALSQEMDIGYGNDEVLETAQKNTEEALEEQYDGLGLDWKVIAKLVSGDGQAVILNFDGPVTTLTD